MKVLVTRALNDLQRKQGKELGLELFECPFIETEFCMDPQQLKQKLMERPEAVLVISSQKAAHLLAMIPEAVNERTIYAVGERSSEPIARSGAHIFHSEESNASSLADRIVADGCKEVVFLCGSKRREDLPNKLKDAGIGCLEWVVYETRSIDARAPITDADYILFASPSAVDSFFDKNTANGSQLMAIGPSTAERIRNYSNKHVEIAEQRSILDMLKQIVSKENLKR